MPDGCWGRVSRAIPCPICGRPDWCLVAVDGDMVICPRTPDGAIKDLGEAGFLHAVDPERVVPLPPLTRSDRRGNRPDFEKILRSRQEQAEPRLHDLARQLGVSVDALRSLKTGYNDYDHSYTFPERDGAGKIIGLLLRYPDGNKLRQKGSHSGLSYADAWDRGEGPVLLVEGPTDTAALMTLVCTAIGRPSNRGGVPLLAELLQDFPEDREIIVIGDNDQKPDGLWPGKEGAIDTAIKLATRLERTVYWCVTPDGVKDPRAWLNAHGGSHPERMRECFLEGLQLQKITPPPTVRVPLLRLPDTLLDDYRDAMVVARLRGIDQPAYYLDRSMTGTGKSTVDLEVVKALLALEGGAV